MQLTHGSLSTGIGGFDIGAANNGIETIWNSEIDPLRQDVLMWLNPKAKQYGDIRTITKPDPVNIVSFGFPCQNISIANAKGKGLEGEKSGLWFDGWRVICAARPGYIVLENSPMLIHKGLGTILRQLAEAGYNAEWQVISCRQFGMPHNRQRLFVVAYSNQIGCKAVDRIQGKKSGKIVSPQAGKEQFFQSEYGRSNSWASWFKTIGRFSALDDGIPRNILQGLLESAGDTVSPIITSWIFARIKAIEIEKKVGAREPATQ